MFGLVTRVAQRWATSAPLTFKLQWSSDHPFIYAYLPGIDFPVGEMELQLVDESFWNEGPCRGDIRKLLGRLGERGIPNPRVYVVRNVHVEREFRHQGIGKGLYEKVLTSCVPGSRSCVLVAEHCVRGKTNPDAIRVWRSVTTRWMSEGFAVAAVPR